MSPRGTKSVRRRPGHRCQREAVGRETHDQGNTAILNHADPYQPPVDGTQRLSSPTVWRMLAFVIVLLCITPLAMTLRVLAVHYIGLSASPSASYRPLVVFVPLYWSFVVGVICLPLFVMVDKFGKKDDAAIAAFGVLFPSFAVPLGLFGPLVICWLTGSSLGS